MRARLSSKLHCYLVSLPSERARLHFCSPEKEELSNKEKAEIFQSLFQSLPSMGKGSFAKAQRGQEDVGASFREGNASNTGA